MPVRAMFGVLAVACMALGLAQFPGEQLDRADARSLATPSAHAPQPAQDLKLTSAVRAALVDAAAAHYGLPASDFVGLGAGPYYDAAYYGYDSATSTYWAAASLVPSPSSYQAGVVVQDDGAYLIFNRTPPGAWQVHDVGYADTVGDCAAYQVSIPAAVVAVWHWVPGTCHPPMTAPPSASAPNPPAPTTGPPGTAAALTVTKVLYAQIRASYYDAYRQDPKPFSVFGVQAGLPESHVVGPVSIEDAGVIYGTSASTSSYWVVADICFGTPTGCEDEGAFQVFHRTGLSGDFAYLAHFNAALDVCDIPQALAQRWFPDGRYPMGGHCASAAAAPRQPVLGSTAFIPRIGVGWGTYRPREIFNGGDPSGMVYGITWTGWGKPESIGHGKTYIFKPTGGYYSRSVTAELAAFDLGRCTTGGPLAYRLLEVRVPSAPGAKFGKWFVWSDVKTLCSPYP